VAITRKNPKARIVLQASNRRQFHALNNVKPDATPERIMNYADAVEMLRGRSTGFVYLHETAELEDA
jgi:hypothetical protein